MRYPPEHKLEIRQKLLQDASHRFRAEGLSGGAVSAVMRGAGLTHGGFYKHFPSKDALLLEALRTAFAEVSQRLAHAAEHSEPGTEWKAIVKLYLSPQHCDHAECGCPLAALAPELARSDRSLRPRVIQELVQYRSRLLPFMPGRRASDKESAFYAIFSTMIGAIAMARIQPHAEVRKTILASARNLLLRSY